MIKLYKAFILPHFEYASPLFIGLSMGLSAKLESTNAFALRTLLDYSRSTAYEELLKIAHIKSLEHRRIEQALKLVYKSIYSQAPNYIQELFFPAGRWLQPAGPSEGCSSKTNLIFFATFFHIPGWQTMEQFAKQNKDV